jgi:sulfatase maturation enzyme AslB (radical SAM superfamily)
MSNKISCGFVNNSLYLSFNGDIRHCCIQQPVDVSSDIKKIKQHPDDFLKQNIALYDIKKDLDNGVKNKHCSACWDLEAAGGQSKRQRSMQGPVQVLRHLDLRLGNKCNLKCKMCFPTWSSQIVNHYVSAKQSGIVNMFNEFADTMQTDGDNMPFLDDSFELIKNAPHLNSIFIAGGEPFIMPEVEVFLEKLSSINRKIKLGILSNITVINDSVLETLKKLDDVTIYCSIDGVGEDLEYQRTSAKWDVIERNFNKLYEADVKTALVPCFSHLNFESVVDFLTWAGTFEKTNVLFNEVTDPSFLNFKLVPLEYRKSLIEQINSFVLPNNAHANYKVFFNGIKSEYRQITTDEQYKLKCAVDIWDHKSKVKYRERYRWADVLLNYEQKF